MSNGLNVFGFENFNSDDQVDRAIKVLERKLDPRLIKQRDAGRGVKLDYIGGHTVIRLLNEAFGYKWSFEIVQDQVVPSQPKFNKWAKGDEPKYEDQPPVVKVLGRLTVPGLGVKEQYGSKVLIGGASEQEAAFKSASTDAMKKCATLFGIGLELYEDDDESPSTATTVVEPAKPAYNKQAYNKQSYNQTPAAQSSAASEVKYDPTDVAKIKELKGILGVSHNSELDPYAREFLDSKDATFQSINPTNIKAFNIFLSKKASNV